MCRFFYGLCCSVYCVLSNGSWIIAASDYLFGIFLFLTCIRPAVENQKIKCNEPMGYTPISYVTGKRNNGTLRIMMP